MASKIVATPLKEEMLEKEGSEAPPDSPLLDLSDMAVKELIRSAKKRGYVTHGQIGTLLSSAEVESDQIEDILAKFSEMGVNVIETKEAEREEEVTTRDEPEEEVEGDNELVEVQQRPVPAKSGAKEPADRSDDPVRIYLREMGSMELLSREGEIAIAKRIEAGREAMIAGLCESPLTFQAIIIWRDELNETKILLRDIIDLEATYAGPDGKNTPKIDMTAPGAQEALAAQRAPATAPLTPPAGLRPAGEEGETPVLEESFDDDEDLENSVSLSAMEAELKPKVLDTFDRIADAYKKHNKLQVQNVENKLKNETLTPAQERRYKTLKKEIVTDVKSLSLNKNRIDALVEQLYNLNKRLIGLETKLLRQAEESGVLREDFLKNYQNSELDPKWLLRVSKLGGRGWKDFVTRRKEKIREIRTDIHGVANETGLA